MENQEHKKTVVEYVGELIDKGISKSEIKARLLAVGWSEDQIESAYGQALIQNGAPTPEDEKEFVTGKKSSAMEIAVNLFSFVLLGVVATALGVLFYQIINKYFPDPLARNYYRGRFSTKAIHYSISALLIGFPMYYLSMRLWFRSFRKGEGKIETLLTKWLTYLVLLVASITIVGDLITALFTFLQGEISIRFVLKAVTILGIFGAIFWFYFLERRKIQYRQEISRKTFQIFGLVISVIIIIGIILGFVAGGSPAMERKRGFDEQRANDLADISQCLENYARQYKRLPNSLEELNKTTYSYCANKKDPKTNKSYEYNIISQSKTVGKNKEAEFELCANFALKSESNLPDGYPMHRYGHPNQWEEHTAGRNCDRMQVVLEREGMRELRIK